MAERAWPDDATVEAVAWQMQHMYETAGAEPERFWNEIEESAREEWRRDARAVLAVVTEPPPTEGTNP